MIILGKTMLPELKNADGQVLVMSFTRLSDYINCPKKFFHKYISCDCPVEVKTSQQRGGTDVHEALKRRFKTREPLPEELLQHERTCATILADTESQHHVELGLGCTADGKPCDFWDPLCRLRGRIDLAGVRPGVAVLIDWKTGKPWEDPLELNVQALLLKIHNSSLERITGFYWWLRTNRPGPLYALDPARTWRTVEGKMTSIKFRIENNDWPPDDNALCPWCPVSKAQCSFRRDPPQ